MIPIIISLILFFNYYENDGVIPQENIVQKKILEEIETKEIKTDEEIFIEIQKKYDEITNENSTDEYKPLPREWQNSGPFSIDRKEYALGEKIFLSVSGLGIDEIGQISILRPLNQTHYSVWTNYPFNGEKVESFNVYFQPSLLKSKEICDKDDLIGNWVMVFKNTNYENIKFKIIEKIVPGDENDYNISVC